MLISLKGSDMADIANKPTPMEYAAQSLTDIYRLIDNSETIDDYLINNFKQSSLKLASAIDRRIALLKNLKFEQDKLKTIKGQYENYLRTVRRIEESVKDYTKYIMEGNPNLQYRGDLGRIALQPSQPKLVLDFSLESRTISNCISDKVLLDTKIPEKYIVKHIHYAIDREAIKTYLGQGDVSLPWARLVRDKHIRIYRA